MIKSIRPAYADRILSRKTLSTTLLDSVYEEIVSSTTLNEESVILMDGWKNSSSNSKIVTCSLNTVAGKRAFLHAWDVTGHSETAEKLCEILSEAIEIARKNYNSEVYAVVSDNASNMVKMGKDMKHIIWHSTCNSHSGNLLAKEVLDKDVSNQVTMVLKEFKQSDFEQLMLIIEKGGNKIQLPCETRWSSYKNAFKCFLNNSKYMKIIAAEEHSISRKLKSNVIALIFDDSFVERVQEDLNVQEPICKLIDDCQNQNTSIADAAHYWMQLKLPNKFHHLLDERKRKVLNDYALVAYYLHPSYPNNNFSKEHKTAISKFLFKNLTNKGCDEWDQFSRDQGIFRNIREKGITKPLLFWRMSEIDCSELPKLAIKLLQIPASSAEIQRIFSNWGYIHSAIRNRLTFEKSKKLVHIYYSLKMKENSDFSWTLTLNPNMKSNKSHYHKIVA